MSKEKIYQLLIIFLLMVIIMISDGLRIFIFKNLDIAIKYIEANAGFFGIMLSVFAIILTYYVFQKTVRPIVFLEIKEHSSGNMAALYNLSISNVGNIPAKNIEYFLDTNAEDVFNYDYKEQGTSVNGSLRKTEDIKKLFNGKISILKNSSEYTGALYAVNPDNSPIYYENKDKTKSVRVIVTYENYITNKKYKEVFELFAHSKENALTSFSWGN